MGRAREFHFAEQDFQRIQRLAGEHTGIQLPDGKRDMVYSRLAPRIRARGLRDFAGYLDQLEASNDPADLTEFINAITTNLTAFFREPHHFEHLRHTLLPQLLQTRAEQRRLRIWSAGCSTGPEPYSIAMVVREVVPADWDVKILATDLDTNVLASAAEGIYAREQLTGVSEDRLKRWFLKGKNGMSGKVRVRQELRDMIRFRQLNLLKDWPVRGPFDLIFCRNVIIYFDKPTQRVLMERYADLLAADGHLLIGHSESLYRVSERFTSLGHTMYRKCA
jgi:chemotaxis protein methyltransferase CheR